MKKLIFILTAIVFFSTSCKKEFLAPNPEPVDNITMLDSNNNVIDQFSMKQSDRISGKQTIKGTLIISETNSTGGHNYTCVSNSSACCVYC